MSRRQAEIYQKNQTQEQQAAAEEGARILERIRQDGEAAVAIKQSIKDQVLGLGHKALDDREAEAEAYSTLYTSWVMHEARYYNMTPQAFHEMVGLRPGYDEATGAITETYNQPVNVGVDLDAPLSTIAVEKIFADDIPVWQARKEYPDDVRKRVLEAFGNEGIRNEDTGWRIILSNDSFRHLLNTKSRGDRPVDIVHYQVIAAMPEIAKSGKLVESYDDQKGIQQIRKMHRLFASVKVGESDYAVRIVVKEYEPGVFGIDEEASEPITVKKLYDHTVEKRLPAGTSRIADLDINPNHQLGPSAGITYTLRQLLEGVKDAFGRPYVQTYDQSMEYRMEDGGHYQEGQSKAPSGEERVIKGSTAFSDGETIVKIFQAGDRSTFLHEMGHVFLEFRRRLSLLDSAPQQIRDDWGKILQWLNIEDIDFSQELSEADAKRWRNAQEQWAAGFEKYLLEGKAPTAELASAFQHFKEWLAAIYKAIKNIVYTDADGNQQAFEINDEIRGVMDRVLASEEEIEAEKAIQNIPDTEQKRGRVERRQTTFRCGGACELPLPGGSGQCGAAFVSVQAPPLYVQPTTQGDTGGFRGASEPQGRTGSAPLSLNG